ncbi:hypothetical protein AGR9A_Lc20084 [Agrobacterium salinitolerans str. Hayward 0363]|nr:hypothetical protein AGR9A_Lc20084 [Agrobacterium salinitolerans str. Hayward 0363]
MWVIPARRPDWKRLRRTKGKRKSLKQVTGGLTARFLYRLFHCGLGCVLCSGRGALHRPEPVAGLFLAVKGVDVMARGENWLATVINQFMPPASKIHPFSVSAAHIHRICVLRDGSRTR